MKFQRMPFDGIRSKFQTDKQKDHKRAPTHTHFNSPFVQKRMIFFSKELRLKLNGR